MPNSATTADRLTDNIRTALTLLTVNDVCDLMQVKQAWVWAQCRAGTMPHLRIGREIRFRAKDLEVWLAAHAGDHGDDDTGDASGG